MIVKSKVAIFSDLHLGVHGNSEDWHKIALQWADWIAQELQKQGIKDIFFLGDFFDNRSEISVQTLHVASEILNKLKAFSIILIVGNHDAFYKNRSDIHSLGLINGYQNCTIVDKNLTIDAFGKTMLFVPWNNELPDGKFDYTFGHFEIQSFRMNNYKVCDKGLNVMDLLGGKTDTVFSGHFHRRDHKKYNEGVVYYVGNTFPIDFSDVENVKGYYILDVETGDLEFFENPVSPKYKKVFLSKIKTVTSQDVAGNIVKLVVDVELEESKLDKVKVYLGKFLPKSLQVEYNVVTNTLDSVEQVDSINILDMFNEFIEQMKLEDDVEERIDGIIAYLYEKNNL
jgi:DNA repair exonuclease SbcCD nuclease subunit